MIWCSQTLGWTDRLVCLLQKSQYGNTCIMTSATHTQVRRYNSMYYNILSYLPTNMPLWRHMQPRNWATLRGFGQDTLEVLGCLSFSQLTAFSFSFSITNFDRRVRKSLSELVMSLANLSITLKGKKSEAFVKVWSKVTGLASKGMHLWVPWNVTLSQWRSQAQARI